MVFTAHFKDAKKQKMVHKKSPSTSSGKKAIGQRPNGDNIDRKQSKKRTRPPKNKDDSKKRQKSSPPSQEALALSAQLKALSTQKRLQDALDLYWNESNSKIRDGHHACIVVDCCGRSGAVQEGEKIVEAMKTSGEHVNVETKTALLKGYAHSGAMHKAFRLYKEMESAKDLKDRPNVRTLNTILRGCLWTAATLQNTVNSNYEMAGGVVTSEKVWPLKNGNSKKGANDTSFVDSSSFEYSVALLCQALRSDEASSRIHLMKETFEISTSPAAKGDCFSGADQSTMESLAFSFLSLARSCALLGRYKQARKAAQNALNAAFGESEVLISDGEGSTKKKDLVTGGKRAWKSKDNENSSEQNREGTRRSVSNSLFRTHRLTGLQAEAEMILKICRKGALHRKSHDIVRALATRLLYFSGGGTTDLSASSAKLVVEEETDQQTDRQHLLNSLWGSFGLGGALRAAKPNVRFPSVTAILDEQGCSNILEGIGIENSVAIAEDGFIDFTRVFQTVKEVVDTDADDLNKRSAEATKRPLNIELGAGFGEWAVLQARSNPSCDYVAVELRADRVGQIFGKAYINNGDSSLQNICCVGSECGSFLRSRVRKGVVSKLFVNHPEPPTQTFGSNAASLDQIARGGAEPAHMLNSQTLLSAAECLQEENCQIVIVTDNRWYARLICSTFLKLMAQSPGLLRSHHIDENCGIRQIEGFPPSSLHWGNSEKVVLYEGQPCDAIGHKTPDFGSNQSQGTSYFDRLWRSGAGTHAETNKRFIIVMERAAGVKKMLAQSEKKKPSKKSEAKQKRRNERRALQRAKVEE